MTHTKKHKKTSLTQSLSNSVIKLINTYIPSSKYIQDNAIPSNSSLAKKNYKVLTKFGMGKLMMSKHRKTKKASKRRRRV
jgi:hypothetical protein